MLRLFALIVQSGLTWRLPQRSVCVLLQGVLSKVGVRAGMGTDPASIAVDRMQSRAAVAEAALQSGQHQRLLRRAIAATVRASSRFV